MLSLEAIKSRFEPLEHVQRVFVEGDGYHHKITVVSSVFMGMSRVKRQQWVYANVSDWITSGALHALTIEAFTIEEWEKRHG